MEVNVVQGITERGGVAIMNNMQQAVFFDMDGLMCQNWLNTCAKNQGCERQEILKTCIGTHVPM